MNNRVKGMLLLLLILAWGHQSDAQRLMTLEQSVQEALQNSPEIVRARLNLERSRELLGAQRASLKSQFRLNVTPLEYSKNRSYNEPLQQWIDTETTSSSGDLSIAQPILWTDGTVSLNNKFQWLDSESSLGGGSGAETGFNNSLNLRLDQPIFTYNKRKQQLKEIEFDYENAQLNYAIQALNVEKQVTQYFYDLYQKQMELITSLEEWENRKKSFEIIKNKVDAGLTAREEMMQAELDMMSSQSTVQNNEVQLENIKDNYKQLMGLPIEEEIMVIAEVSVLPVDVDLREASDYALSNRMEIRQRQISIELGQFDIIATNAQNEFEGNVALSVGLFGNDEKFPDIYNTVNNNQDVSLTLNIPLWDWGEKKAKMKAAQAALKEKEYNLDDEKKNIIMGIRQVHRNLRNTLIQIDIARKNEENAQLTYEINLEKYKNGDLTSMDLNLFQNQLTEKKNTLTGALISYKMELLNMKLQTLYDFENKVSILPDVMNYESMFDDN